MARLDGSPGSRGDFSSVLDTVGRGSSHGFAEGSLDEDDEEAREDEAEPTAVTPPAASFDFLQALGSVVESQAAPADEAGNDYANLYADAALEAEQAPQPEYEADRPAESPTAEAPAGVEAAADAPSAQESPAPDPASENLDPAALAAELGLRPGLKPAELRRMRRAFALANHPDRLDASRRELASRRMMLANSLIDEALRRAGTRR